MSTQSIRKEEVLMVVKTYPTPSSKYGELVCTAGIRLRDNTWVRIYPYPFRQAKTSEQFEKYDVIEVAIERETKDPRPDSFRLYDLNSIQKLRHLGPEKSWAERMHFIRKTSVESVEALVQGMLYEDKTKWGKSILPVPVLSSTAKLSWDYRGEEWKDEDLEKLKSAANPNQQSLFATSEAKSYFQTLKRIPYTFRLTFKDLTEKEYTFPILDWEIAQLFLKMRASNNSDDLALEKVRFKIENQIFKADNEVFVILGNIHHRFKKRDSLAVDGFIYPKRQQQFSLFGGEGV
jgi:hypothetical protein